MKIGVVSGPETSMIEDAKEVCSVLDGNGAELVLEEKLAHSMGTKGKSLRRMSVDTIIVIGSDRTLLNSLLVLGDNDIPILPITSKGQLHQTDFLFEPLESLVRSILCPRAADADQRSAYPTRSPRYPDSGRCPSVG